MKLMTLNTHSWLETEPLEKLKQIAGKIVKEKYDVIALQEVNQLMGSETLLTEELAFFCPVENQTPIHEDNFAYQLVQLLAEGGETYYWSWEMSHIGYDIYQEGNAILSKTPLKSQAVLVSETKEKENYRTRKMIVGKTTIDEQQIQIIGCHFSWWKSATSGFAYEWQELQNYLASSREPLFLLGDFNHPEDSEGYQLIEKSQWPIKDAFIAAKQKAAAATIEKKIDGWENNTEALRIDYIYVPSTSDVKVYQRIFDGENESIVSDHFGVEVELMLVI
ncbi:MAG: endonuclease/exonuclease/phosphatase family protein [Enterococcus sp.]